MKLKKSTRNMILTKRKDHTKNLTDVRFWLKISQLKLPRLGRLDNLIRMTETNLSWQNRIQWAKHISEYKGSRQETLEYYTVLYNSRELAESKMAEKSARMKGENNPWANHGGTLSPFSDKFIGKTSKKDAIAAMQNTFNAKPEVVNTKLEYYLNKGLGLCQAQSALKERQSVGRLDKFQDRYGEDEGTIKWKARQEKWLKNCKRTNFSLVSQKLFDELYVKLNSNLHDVYYATLERPNMVEYINKEYTLRLDASYIKPDFICLNTKKIIEFDGDYWHNGTHANPSREAKRDMNILNAGYEILHIKESDYKKNKEREITKCINFLTQ